MKNFDWILLLAILLITITGLVLIYSTTYQSKEAPLFKKQLIFFFLGLGVLITAYYIPFKIEYIFSYWLYIILILLLGSLLVLPGGVNRWIDLGAFQFQPSGLAKVIVIFTLARFLFDNRKNINSLRTVGIGFLLTIIPFYLVIKEPNLSTGLILLVLYVGLLWISGLKGLYIFLIISPVLSMITAFHWITWALYFIALIVILYLANPDFRLLVTGVLANLVIGIITPIIWNGLSQYQRDRILVYLDPSKDPFGAGYQIIQSKITIGSGGLLGKGFLNGTQTNLAFLPTRSTDFIFATLGEQFGFLGTGIIIVLFAIVLLRIIHIIRDSRKIYAKFVTTGIGILFFLQIFVNLGMTLGFLPVTGIPLPFMSYGGTSLVVSYFMVGVLLRAYKKRKEY